jgi:hypothetical protein
MTQTFYPKPIDIATTGYISHSGTKELWATHHDAADGAANNWSILSAMFQASTDTNKWFAIVRGGVSFDATALTGIITSAKIRLYCESILNEFGAYSPVLSIYTFSPTDPASYDSGDYSHFGTTRLCDTNVWPTGAGWYEFPLNAAGLALLSAGVLSFGLRLVDEAADTPPAPPSWVYDQVSANFTGQAYQPELDTNCPQLVVEALVLTVRTDPATDVSSTSATLNGTLMDGGDDVTCSFEAGLTSACDDWAGGAKNVDTPDPFDAQFDAVAAAIPSGSTVYFRAKAVLGALTAYGDVLSFTLANFPVDGLMRVSSIIDRYKAGSNGQPGEYRMELVLGGLSTVHLPPFSQTMQTLPEQTPQTPAWRSKVVATDYQRLMSLYGRWLASRSKADQMKVFGGHQPSLNEWIAWYKANGGQ